jgi:hypothetical protein
MHRKKHLGFEVGHEGLTEPFSNIEYNTLRTSLAGEGGFELACAAQVLS